MLEKYLKIKKKNLPQEDFEEFLAKLYTNESFLKNFLDFPEQSFVNFQLTRTQKESLLSINKEDLIEAAKNFRKKREMVIYSNKKITFFKKISSWFQF